MSSSSTKSGVTGYSTYGVGGEGYGRGYAAGAGAGGATKNFTAGRPQYQAPLQAPERMALAAYNQAAARAAAVHKNGSGGGAYTAQVTYGSPRGHGYPGSSVAVGSRSNMSGFSSFPEGGTGNYRKAALDFGRAVLGLEADRRAAAPACEPGNSSCSIQGGGYNRRRKNRKSNKNRKSKKAHRKSRRV